MANQDSQIHTALQEQIDELQSRLLHQEDMISSLNTVIAKQDKAITLIVDELKQQKNKLNDVSFSINSDSERPPHY